MRTKTTTFLIAIMLAAGTIFSGCQSAEKKEENANEKVQDAEQELMQAQQKADAQAAKAVNDEEWRAFKIDAQEKINKNEARIVELKTKKQKPGKMLDSLYEKRIETLVQKNNELKAKIDAYEMEHSDWETFKREFNHDMDELGQALKDITVDNKK